MSDDKVIKIGTKANNYTPEEILEMALKDIQEGNIETDSIMILTDNSTYAGGISSRFEAAGYLVYSLFDAILR